MEQNTEVELRDDDLLIFNARGAPRLPVAESRFVANARAQIWHCSLGSGTPVVLLHGGLGHSGNWGYQIPFLLENGFRVILIDSRGHGRSTRDRQPDSYDLMASDVLAVLDALRIETAFLVGWSDGACIAMVLGATAPSRVSGVFFFGCNMDPSGLKPFQNTPVLDRCIFRHKRDYSELSAMPDRFGKLQTDLSLMQTTQPSYSAEDLERISVPVTVAQSEFDEFIRTEHAEFIARTIPNARYVFLSGVSHFAPLQRPLRFNAAVMDFVGPFSASRAQRVSRVPQSSAL